MKRRFAFLWVSFALFTFLAGCGPSFETRQMAASALVRVECQNASRQEIVQLLRSVRGKDINITVDATGMVITAAFSPSETPTDQLLQILQELNGLSGVMRVEVMENPRPIRQNF